MRDALIVLYVMDNIVRRKENQDRGNNKRANACERFNGSRHTQFIALELAEFMNILMMRVSLFNFSGFADYI